MKVQELKNKSVDELKAVVTDMKKEQFNLRFQAAAGEQVPGSRMRQARRTVARAMTLINQKKKDK